MRRPIGFGSRPGAEAAAGFDRRVVAVLREPGMAAWLLACAGSIVMYLFVRHLSHPSMVDLVVYRAEGLAVRDGIDLYGPLNTPHGLGATYPPFAAMLFVPLTYLPKGVLLGLGVATNLALVALVVWLSMRLVDPARRLSPVLVPAGTTLAIWFEPVFTTMRFGQVNLAVLAVVLWDFTRPPGARWRGAGLGIVAGIKVTPAVFIVYLLLTGRRREAVTAIGAAAATVALSAAVLPDATRRFWTRLVFDPSRVGRLENAANQSMRGLLTRLTRTLDPGVGGTLVVIVVAVLGMACAVVAYRRQGDAWGLPASAVAGLLISPISWTHHWVWCVPIALLLWTTVRGAHSRAQTLLFAGLLVFPSFVVWSVPHLPGQEWHMTHFEQLRSACYVAFGLAFLAVAARPGRVRAGPADVPDPGRGPLGAGPLAARGSRSYRPPVPRA
ncbi:glycosyltransferase 87 family protein [Embleya sp. AB8]|uniref:glycosyltransferase 87 family protein n=1 Tax=Embleya sp. AB8 TaxID=3156304 RepID=UPI003C76DB80